METFVNPLYGGEDPFIIKGNDGFYYHCAEAPGAVGINIYKSKKLTDRGVMKRVFTAPADGWNSHDVWAPEMWYLQGKWYIYYAASCATGMENWQQHRMGVLEADNPMGPYHDKGMLELGDYMAIDGTILQLDDGSLYIIYMRRETPTSPLCLYIAPMDNPYHVCGEPCLLSQPEYPWEGIINEGPIPVNRNGKIRILYSANSAGSPDYCLAALCCKNPSRILERDSWEKLSYPLFKAKGNIIGPGHASFTTSPDGSEDWLVYHSKSNHLTDWPACWNRVVNIQKFTWDEENALPIFGDPIPFGIPQSLPSGQQETPLGEFFKDDFTGSNDGWMELNYFAGDSIKMNDGRYTLDASLDPDYGEKVIVRDMQWTNFTLETSFHIGTGGKAGILFRATNFGDRKQLYTGYAVMVSDMGLIQLGYSLRHCFEELAQINVETRDIYNIKIITKDENIAVFLDENKILSLNNTLFNKGFVGLIAEDSCSSFLHFHIQQL